MKKIIFTIFAISMGLSFAACQPDYPNCKKDSHCHAGEYCVNNLCQQCKDNGDCGEGSECVNGGCSEILNYCAENSDCAGGQICRNNTCGPCLQNSDCQDENVCVDGLCLKAECRADGECPAGLYCINYKCSVDESRNSDLGAGDCELNPVYFDFDSTEISDQMRDVLDDNFACLQKRGGRVTLEGHCDSLGTTEYNMALGERRSRVVGDLLKRMGAAASDLKIISKGEEEATGSNETTRQKDRRVDFK
ncbi:MAG: OmpA family protein [Deltaproteobacteria bacterium]|nr:OmpA family protein [Deltaproteobacteria bacterium]